MKTPINWGKRVVRALLVAVAITLGLFFFAFFGAHANEILEKISFSLVEPGVFAAEWLVPETQNVFYHDGRRLLVNFIANTLFYALLVLLIPMALRSFSSAKANGE